MTRNYTKLWKYNRVTGYWDQARTCDLDTAQAWLETFQEDEPKEVFKLSKNRPHKPWSPK